jgi:hypothetical protein
MTSAAVEAAARYADRPGFNLVTFREVGLPIYRQTVLTVVMVDKKMPAMQEFALRAVDAGFETAPAVADFLGLDERDLDEALYGLVTDQFLKLRSGSDGVDALSLTPLGRQAMEEFRISQAEERTYVVDSDGLLRKPVAYQSGAVREKVLTAAGALPIAPSPPSKPDVLDLEINQIEPILRQSKSLDKSRKLLELLRVARTETLFVRATMLVFRAHVGDEIQAAFVVDGRLSEEIGLAFAESDGPARIGLLQASEPSLRSAADEVLGGDAGDLASDLLDQQQRADIDGEGLADAAGQGRTMELLETFDHPRYLELALESKEILIIVSPWIKRRVVTDAFVGKLATLLRQGAKVYIGFGFGRDDASDDRDALRALQRLADEHSNFTFRRFGDSHAKVLLSDSNFAVVTSFNWLSFLGDPARTFRDERGMLVRRTGVVDEIGASLLARFAAASPPERL